MLPPPHLGLVAPDVDPGLAMLDEDDALGLDTLEEGDDLSCS